MKLTITEALAEIKTLAKRIEKKEQTELENLVRPDIITDPHEDGSDEWVRRELQATGDLRRRWVALRQAIATANSLTELVIEGDGRTVSEWLIWRREVATGERRFIDSMRATIMRHKQQITGTSTDERPVNAIVHTSEPDLAKNSEQLEVILGELDGKLSLLNATTFVEVAD